MREIPRVHVVNTASPPMRQLLYEEPSTEIKRTKSRSKKKQRVK